MSRLYEPTPIAAAKVYAEVMGDHGHSGGWIHNPSGKPIVQGWRRYAQSLEWARLIVPKSVNGDTRWAVNWSASQRRPESITCDHHACPKLVGGLYGVNA